jgi:hypothetical protein
VQTNGSIARTPITVLLLRQYGYYTTFFAWKFGDKTLAPATQKKFFKLFFKNVRKTSFFGYQFYS